MKQINVKEIVAQIQEDVNEKRKQFDLPDFKEIPIGQGLEADDIYGLINQMQQTYFIEWNQPIPLGIKGFLKKIIRKLSGFLLAPIVDAQSNYNAAVLSVFEQLLMELEEQKQSISVMEKRLADLDKQKEIKNVH